MSTRYKGREYLESLGDDTEDENPENQENLEEVVEKPVDPEEETFKKRYSDLRSHTSKLQNDLKAEIDQLKAQLADSNKPQFKLPKSEEELAEWSKKYPDVAAIVESIAMKKAKEISDQLDNRIKEVDEFKTRVNMENALKVIREAHPDFDDIRANKDFHEKWVPTQSEWVRNALYKNTSDPQAVIDVLDLYKSRDPEKVKTQTAAERKKAAETVGKNLGSSPRGDDEILFRESDIKKMSDHEYEKNEEKITQAIREGKFEYDVTGAAR